MIMFGADITKLFKVPCDSSVDDLVYLMMSIHFNLTLFVGVVCHSMENNIKKQLHVSYCIVTTHISTFVIVSLIFVLD